jgi:DnaJ-class molecular chaperone
MLWRMQHEVSYKLFTVLENCNGLYEQFAKAPEQVKAIENIAKNTLAVVPKLAPVSKTDPKYAAYKSISADIASLSNNDVSISARLQTTKKIRKEYIAACGYVACPLCKATGRHEGTDCPVCDGDREIEERFEGRIDLSAYDRIECPLCDGEGSVRAEQCPACGGECRMDRRYAETVDVSEYDKVDCPLCKGTSRFKGDDCPACSGLGEMDRRHVDEIDLREYKEVDCPLCERAGQYDGSTCPECQGNGRMQRRFADQVDLREYKKVNCPVCEGKARYKGNDCPACGGLAKINRRDAAGIGGEWKVEDLDATGRLYQLPSLSEAG